MGEKRFKQGREEGHVNFFSDGMGHEQVIDFFFCETQAGHGYLILIRQEKVMEHSHKKRAGHGAFTSRFMEFFFFHERSGS